MRRSFSDVTRVVPRSDTAFDFVIDPEWTIDGRPNGGYLLGALARAATEVAGHSKVLTASGLFLASPLPGPAAIEIEVLRAGRTVSQVRARLSQDGSACLEASFTIGEIDTGSVPRHRVGFPESGHIGPDEGSLLPSQGPGFVVTIMDQVELRLDSMHPFTTGPSGRGELWGWLSLPEDGAFDPISLIYALDALPPATFDVELSGWVPTLSLTAYIRAMPAPGPVRILQQARLIDDGRVDEVCYVWDTTGRLVAHGTQLAGIRLG